jgi:2-enoate reductase
MIPRVPGVDRSNVLTAWDVLAGKQTGKAVVVAGAGMCGIETAIFLAKQGKNVVLIEGVDRIASNAGSLNKARLEEELKATTVEIRCKTRLSAIEDGGARVEGETGQYLIPCDTVVLSIGTRPDDGIGRSLRAEGQEMYLIGDCSGHGNMLEAIHDAYDVASAI